ncbi:MAG: hypothetical protein J5365_00950 [Erysipelotrichaceae bacterium]|nr:hypothetical protein [Erysipelotrichaceae bacterium]
MYYLIEQTLRPVSEEEYKKSRKARVAVLNRTEWEKKKKDLPFTMEIDRELEQMLTTEANVNFDSLSGTFSIPDRSNLDNEDFRFAYALNKRNVVFVDDSGYVKNALEEIIRTKKWNTPCLERFFYDFLDQIVKDDLRIMEKFEKQLDEMEAGIQKDDKDISLNEANYIRGSIRYLLIHYEQLMDLAQELDENENGFFDEKNLRYFTSYISRLDRLYNNAASLRDYSIQIRDLYQESIAVKQNNIMTLLTVVTSVFMPLTLITGWYGMNFKYMPELNVELSYPVVFIVCIVIVIVSMLYFKKKKWL